MRLLLSGDIESNPGPANPTESNRNRKQNKSFPSSCQQCNKKVKANSKRLLCIHWNNMVHLKCIGTNSTKRLKSYDPHNNAYIIVVIWRNYHFSIHKIYRKKLFQYLIKPFRTTFILKLWKRIETILVSNIWTPSPWVLNLMNSK